MRGTKRRSGWTRAQMDSGPSDHSEQRFLGYSSPTRDIAWAGQGTARRAGYPPCKRSRFFGSLWLESQHGFARAGIEEQSRRLAVSLSRGCTSRRDDGGDDGRLCQRRVRMARTSRPRPPPLSCMPVPHEAFPYPGGCSEIFGFIRNLGGGGGK